MARIAATALPYGRNSSARFVTTLAQSKPLMIAFLTVVLLCQDCAAQVQADELKILSREVKALHAQGAYLQAISLARQGLRDAEESLAPDQPEVAEALNNLAELYVVQGEFAQAEPLFKRSLEMRERVLGLEHPDVAESLNNLAGLYELQGQFAQIESMSKRALSITEKARGSNHPDVAKSMRNLASYYYSTNRRALAEQLFKRALEIREKALGLNHPDVAESLGDMSVLYGITDDKAEQLIKRSLAIRENALGSSHPSVATSLNDLGMLYYWREKIAGKFTQAETLFRRALEIREKILGPNHLEVAWSLHNLAALYDDLGQYAHAEQLFKRSLAILEKALGRNHPAVAKSLGELAAMYNRIGQHSNALSLVRRSSALFRERIVAGGAGDEALHEATWNRYGFFAHLALLAKNPDNEPANMITDESLQIVQLIEASGTAAAIAKMSARLSSDDDTLASLIKQRHDISERRARVEVQLLRATSKPVQERHSAINQALRDESAALMADITRLDAELKNRFPEYKELSRFEPLGIDEIRSLLKPGEAMLVYSIDFSSYLWVVTPDVATFIPLTKVKKNDLSTKVSKVRAQMEFDDTGSPPRVSVQVLHDLYQKLLHPAASYLTDVKHLIVVPTGPLQSLPFSILVTTPPTEIRSDADYLQIDWLAKHFAVSVLPGVGSIKALRQFPKAAGNQESFAGFGDPLVGGRDSALRGRRAKLDMATVFRNLVDQKSGSTNSASEIGIADVAAIRGAARLPETADELMAMAQVFGADQSSLWLRDKATETQVKQVSLSSYRTLAFATHGVMAGEVDGIGEPGLIMTPPKEGTLEDDGYLSASEVAQLKLNADWVLLSACNTAAADGTPGAEGLSGLAKAFFYAGARSLLVSHWPVASEATVALTTEMLSRYKAHPNEGKAEAHRHAVLTLMNNKKHPEYAHPLFWAPFVVVGEGGAGAAHTQRHVVQ